MTDGLKDEHRTAIVNLLRSNERVERAVLFGSRAMETFTQGSDVDIALFGKSLTIADQARLAAAMKGLTIPQRVDLLLYDGIEDATLRKHVQQDGIELYKRQERASDVRLDVPKSFPEQIQRQHSVPTNAADELHPRRPRVAPEEWRRSSIFSLAHWKNGLAFKNIDFAETGRPIIKIAELKAGVTSRTARTMADYGPSVFVGLGDMLFSWSGNPDTSIDVFRWEGEDGWLNQHIFKVTPYDGVSGDFLFFLLKWLKPRFAEIARNKQTTGLGHVTIQDLKQTFVSVPDTKEQADIVGVIGPIQRKIDLNRKMNETLEAMARAIFKDWFVDFGPTRAKAEGRAPYLAPELWDLFPDALDEEDKPIGWRWRKLADIAESPRRSVNPADVPENTPYIGLEHMPGHSIALSKWEGAGKVRSNKTGFHRGEILFGKLRPYFHKVGVAPLDGICSTDIVVVVPQAQEWRAFAIACLSSDEFVNYTDRTSTGTKMPRTSWKTMAQYKMCLPPERVACAFEAIARPLLERLGDNIHETITLTETRDLLLPKLMSGEIRLTEAEKAVEAIV